MTRTALTAVLTAVVLVLGQSWLQRPLAQSAPDVITDGCGIPKAYGRLVSVVFGQTGGPNAGITYSVFEDEDGVIRWVAAMPVGSLLNTQPPPKGQIAPMFISKYECALSTEWKRH